MSSHRLGVDTNVFVYAMDRAAPEHKTAVEWLEKIGRRDYIGVISCQNLAELYGVTTSKKAMGDKVLSAYEAGDRLGDIIDGRVFEVVYPSGGTIDVFRDLLARVKPRGQLVHDMFLAATLLSNGVDMLLTANGRDFSKIRELKIVDLA